MHIAHAPARPVPTTLRATERAPARERGGAIVVAVGTVIGVVTAALYLRTAARDIVFGDSPELTGAAITLGVAHPPGYPLWTMLAHIFSRFCIGK